MGPQIGDELHSIMVWSHDALVQSSRECSADSMVQYPALHCCSCNFDTVEVVVVLSASTVCSVFVLRTTFLGADSLRIEATGAEGESIGAVLGFRANFAGVDSAVADSDLRLSTAGLSCWHRCLVGADCARNIESAHL